MPRSAQYVCVKDRRVFRSNWWFGGSWHCPDCREDGIRTSYHWRPPKRNNDKAWAIIAAGDWLWDKKALSKVRLLTYSYQRANKKYRKSEIEVDRNRPTRPR